MHWTQSVDGVVHSWWNVAVTESDSGRQPLLRMQMTLTNLKDPLDINDKGWVRLTDRMNFRKSSKRLLTPPPHFRKVTLRFSRQNCDKSAYVHMEEHLCIL